MSTHDSFDDTNKKSDQDQTVVALPGDERDVLITRVIDGVATSEDWTTFRLVAAHDPSIWAELAETQHVHESMSQSMHSALMVSDRIELPGGIMDDAPLRSRLDIVSKWGGWAAAAAILFIWFFGNPAGMSNTDIGNEPVRSGTPGAGLFLNDAQPDQAFDRYLNAGQSNGQVVGEMPEQIVIETRPMQDGTIEVLYLRQIIERRIIDHAYREVQDESGNLTPFPVRLSPSTNTAF